MPNARDALILYDTRSLAPIFTGWLKKKDKKAFNCLHYKVHEKRGDEIFSFYLSKKAKHPIPVSSKVQAAALKTFETLGTKFSDWKVHQKELDKVCDKLLGKAVTGFKKSKEYKEYEEARKAKEINPDLMKAFKRRR